jgi:transposase
MAQRKTRRRSYPSDLTDEQWEFVEPLLPPVKIGGGRRSIRAERS